MKKLQNSLYITRQGAYVHKERETIVIEHERQKLMQVPIHSVSGLFCFGNVLVSPALMGFCGEKGVNLAFFTEYGRFYGRLQGKKAGNVLLRRAQYHADSKTALEIARSSVAAKLVGARNVLLRHQRNHGISGSVERAVKHLAASIRLARYVDNLDSLRGIEGDAAATYFSAFEELINENLRGDFPFSGRNRRPPRDPVNALLSFVYAILGQDISAALNGVGLDPQVGFLHADRPGRDSLSQDLLEEFRPWLADRLVLSLINRRQLKASDFITESSGAVRMSDDARKQLLVAYQERKQQEVMHPFLKEKVPIGIVPHLQAMLLARHLRNDLERYPPCVLR
ncbi:type I-C CRISPR-associated endonuclease Cas1 [Marinobacter halodurans]|uniref:CRISPR-associated endonuclease Cas1 n=1 Tax=Marinobacter halodurans TaxID=2528979 RepID=A0ABY1ZJN4_9GAMM|nr:type I-C CRISPR-associated endonuclease Cas1c [Marinobacter halodurans]TBW55214.1 type I-C CRISPR-associated endonuclease Cas1 [Marinobacter halodurans]